MSWLERELYEQPAALTRFLRAEVEATHALAAELGAAGVRYVVIAARGSSDNAARYAQYLLGVANRLPVALATPSLYTLYRSPPRLQSALVARDRERVRELLEVPARVAEQIELSAAGSATLDRFADFDSVTVVGRGIAYGTAFEVALKLRELSGIQVEAFSGADILHGPIAALGARTLVFLVVPSGPALGGVPELLEELRAHSVPIVAVSDDPLVLGRADAALPLVRGLPEWLSPLTAVVPGQLAALRLATLRGIDVDRPHGLHKVTQTR